MLGLVTTAGFKLNDWRNNIKSIMSINELNKNNNKRFGEGGGISSLLPWHVFALIDYLFLLPSVPQA